MSRKIIMNLAVSLDGYIEGPAGEIDWCFTDQDYGMTAFLDRIDTILFGRKSYDQLLEMGPEAFPGKKRVVYTTKKADYGKEARVINKNVIEETGKIKNDSGKDIWLFGGAQLNATIWKANLVDELMLAVHPVILGGGKPVFTDLENRKNLELADTRTYSSGLVQLIYKIPK